MHVVLVSPQVPEGVVPPQLSQTRWRTGQRTASDGGGASGGGRPGVVASGLGVHMVLVALQVPEEVVLA